LECDSLFKDKGAGRPGDKETFYVWECGFLLNEKEMKKGGMKPLGC
jgi:hypothetical protein